MNDFRFAARQLKKAPGFSLAVVFTLALGVGVNVAVFSMLDGFLLRGLPYPQPNRLAALIMHKQGTDPRSGKVFSEEDNSHDGHDWEAVRDNVPAVQAAAYGIAGGANLRAGSAVMYVHSMRVSAHYFNVLGIRPFMGRGFTPEEDRVGGPPAVVLSYGLWKNVLGGDPNILGRRITLKGQPFTVVGVLPDHAQTPDTADLWTALQPSTTGEGGGSNYGILLRLRDGATWAQAGAQLARLRTPAFDELVSQYKGKGWLYAEPLARSLGDGMRPQLQALMLAVGCILLIACANLAGLTLVRLNRRTPEIATRLALGATRWAVLRQLWIECAALSLMGAVAGLGLAYGLLRLLSTKIPDFMVPIGGLVLDGRVLAFAFAAAFVASLLFGGLPALRTRRVDLRSSIASGGRSLTQGSSRLRQTLIAGEVALTVVLLAGAGVFVRSLIHLETLAPGFDARNVMTARASLDDFRFYNAATFHALLDRSVAEMRQIPGVEAAAAGLSVPYQRGLNEGVHIKDGKFSGTSYASSVAWVTPGYFDVLRIPLLAGRTPLESDTAKTQPVAIVNPAFAKRFYGETNPIGRHFEIGGDMVTIVGLVADVSKHPGVTSDVPMGTEPVVYLPAAQTGNMGSIWFQPSWIVRTRGPVAGLTGAMQRALSSVDPGLPFSGFYSMDEVLANNLLFQRVEVLLLGTLSALALLLSAIGIYALVSNLVVERTREIGIRIALGSSIREAMMKIGSSGLAACVAGIAGGLALSFIALRAVAGYIYGVVPYDPATLLIVPLALALVALAASLLPTLRIARIDPAETLRAE